MNSPAPHYWAVVAAAGGGARMQAGRPKQYLKLRGRALIEHSLHVLMQLTEPVLAPVRRIIPPAGMFDLSFIVVFIGLQIVISAVLKCPGRILG